MIAFKQVTPVQVDLLRDLSLDTFRHSFYHQNTPENYELYVSKALSREMLFNELNTSSSEFHFGYLDLEIVSYFKLNFKVNSREVYSDDSLEIQRIYVVPDYLSKGIGGITIDFIKKYSRERNYKNIWLGVWEHNPGAIRFYERHGFVHVGKHRFMLGNEEQTDLIMEYEL